MTIKNKSPTGNKKVSTLTNKLKTGTNYTNESDIKNNHQQQHLLKNLLKEFGIAQYLRVNI